ncbi:MAG: hypothetical protein Q9226_005575 [Calogaya cf. arnoldii]
METSETPETLKRSLFQELYELDVPDDSVNDTATLLAALRAAKSAPKAPTVPQAFNRRRAIHAPRQLQQLGRTVSAPTGLTTTTRTTSRLLTTKSLSVGGDEQSEAVASSVSESPVVEEPRLKSKTSADPLAQKSPIQMAPSAKGNGKRKRGRSPEILPEAQQIFRGLRFYFLPNDDVAPARKLRINKVLERGGTWIKDWTDDVTHIIVDRHLTYADLLKYLKKPSIPANIAVVNENYPAECIEYRTVVNPDQVLYHVRGRPRKVVAEQKDRSEDSTVNSLPLKPGKRAIADPSPTPSRTEASEQLPAHCHTAVDTVVCTPPTETHRTGSEPRNAPADALDEAIEEMRAIKDLVSSSAKQKVSCITDRDSL